MQYPQTLHGASAIARIILLTFHLHFNPVSSLISILKPFSINQNNCSKTIISVTLLIDNNIGNLTLSNKLQVSSTLQPLPQQLKNISCQWAFLFTVI